MVWTRTSSVLTVRRGESGGVVDVELVGCVSGRRAIEERYRRRACRPSLGDLGRQPQVLQHAPNDGGIVDECDQGEPAATAGTGEDIQTQTAAHQLRPEVVTAVTIGNSSPPLTPSPSNPASTALLLEADHEMVGVRKTLEAVPYPQARLAAPREVGNDDLAGRTPSGGP